MLAGLHNKARKKQEKASVVSAELEVNLYGAEHEPQGYAHLRNLVK
jgi:hypothetical protein